MGVSIVPRFRRGPPAENQASEEAEAAANGGSRSPGRPQTTNLTSKTYLQTYVIMKPTGTETFGTNNAYRDVLFRCVANLGVTAVAVRARVG